MANALTITARAALIEDLCVYYGTDPRIWREMDLVSLDIAWVVASRRWN